MIKERNKARKHKRKDFKKLRNAYNSMIRDNKYKSACDRKEKSKHCMGNVKEYREGQ